MKTKARKILTSIIAFLGLAIPTITISSALMVSCSSSPENPGEGDSGLGGGGSEIIIPSNKKEINFSADLKLEDYNSPWLYPSNVNDWQIYDNLLDNKVKWFDDNNEPIVYEQVVEFKNLYGIGLPTSDILKPFDVKNNLYVKLGHLESNDWIVRSKVRFSKKENNDILNASAFNYQIFINNNWIELHNSLVYQKTCFYPSDIQDGFCDSFGVFGFFMNFSYLSGDSYRKDFIILDRADVSYVYHGHQYRDKYIKYYGLKEYKVVGDNYPTNFDENTRCWQNTQSSNGYIIGEYRFLDVVKHHDRYLDVGKITIKSI